MQHTATPDAGVLTHSFHLEPQQHSKLIPKPEKTKTPKKRNDVQWYNYTDQIYIYIYFKNYTPMNLYH